MPADLLLEIGTEEMPAEVAAGAQREIVAEAGKRLRAARLDFDSAIAVGTPRRLALLVKGLADRQPDLSERVVGPPAKVAFGADGKPTKAAEGFARKNGVELADLERGEVEGKKGEYVLCTRHEPGRSALEVLPPLCNALIAELPWPKPMRWAACEQPFVRPVHWIVALHGDEVLPVSFAGVRAGRKTRGHRFLAPAEIEVSVATYAEKLRSAFVIVDPAVRRDMIAAELVRVEGEEGARVRPDDALIDEVSFLVEYPKAVCGRFDEAFLEVPEEVIVSAMRSHQRYFAMEDARGALINKFVTIAGTVTRDLDVVRRGNERVLAARLSDAQFFFREDRKRSLEALAGKLDGVVFQSRLGSVGAKVARVRAAAEALAHDVGADPRASARAAALCKADLVSSMVYEFPDLQGVMGGHYARLAGEPAAVATAIAEHYLPRGAGDQLPGTDVGAVVGVADRIDTLVGCFAVGLVPSGSADPYGLRRAALAVLSILLGRGWQVSLEVLLDRAVEQLGSTVQVSREGRAAIGEFLKTRLKGLLVDGSSLPADCVEAALTAGYANVPDARARAAAVAGLRERPDFEPLATAFKRVANILKGEAIATEPDPSHFTHEEERALWQGFGDIRARAESRLGDGDYQGSLQILAELKAPVDRFFDAVLVMDEDERVRSNRLALLGRINATFARIADFRQLSV